MRREPWIKLDPVTRKAVNIAAHTLLFIYEHANDKNLALELIAGYIETWRCHECWDNYETQRIIDDHLDRLGIRSGPTGLWHNLTAILTLARSLARDHGDLAKGYKLLKTTMTANLPQLENINAEPLTD